MNLVFLDSFSRHFKMIFGLGEGLKEHLCLGMPLRYCYY